MSHGSHSISRSHHQVRFYIVMATLIVGGIFILLLLNNDGDSGSSITNAIVSAFNNETDESESVSSTITGAVTGSKKPTRDIRDIDVELTFDKIPTFREEDVAIGVLEVHTNFVEGILLLDGSEVQTQDEKVVLRLEGVSGLIESGKSLILYGEAKKVVVNNIALSSDKKRVRVVLDTSFDELIFENLDLSTTFALNGNGELSAGGGALEHMIEDGVVSIKSFRGHLAVQEGSKNSTASMALNGIADSVSVNSDLLSLSLG